MEVEPPPLEERRRLQEELSEFVESCCRTLEEVTASLGWSLDQLDPGDEAAAEVRDEVARPLRGCGLLVEGKAPVGSRSLRVLHPGAVQRSRARRVLVPGVQLVGWTICFVICHKDSALR